MTEQQFRETMEKEIDLWQQRLSETTGKIDALPSIQKYLLTPYINELHILLTEMQERIDQIRDSDDSFWQVDEEEVKVRMDDFRNTYNESSGVHMDYDYSG